MSCNLTDELDNWEPINIKNPIKELSFSEDIISDLKLDVDESGCLVARFTLGVDTIDKMKAVNLLLNIQDFMKEIRRKHCI